MLHGTDTLQTLDLAHHHHHHHVASLGCSIAPYLYLMVLHHGMDQLKKSQSPKVFSPGSCFHE